jgi:hypothetical protein
MRGGTTGNTICYYDMNVTGNALKVERRKVCRHTIIQYLAMFAGKIPVTICFQNMNATCNALKFERRMGLQSHSYTIFMWGQLPVTQYVFKK